MTRTEALAELVRLKEVGDKDPEEAHSKADGVLLDLINDDEITEAFQDIDKWYA